MKHSTSSTGAGSFWGRNEFLIRRLHSLSGLLPVGAFLCVHLLTNASVMAGPGTFQDQVEAIHRLGPALPLIEWVFIFIPLIFHAAVGVVIAVESENNTGSYRYGGNVRYMLQRVTAWIALFFILWHVFHMHGWFHFEWWVERVARPLSGAQFDAERATSTAAVALLGTLPKILYAVGILASVYHLANGLWTMGITWGVWTSAAAQRRANYLCGAFGLVLAAVGLAGLVGMSKVDIPRAKAIEQVRIEQRKEAQMREQRMLEPPTGPSTGSSTGAPTTEAPAQRQNR